MTRDGRQIRGRESFLRVVAWRDVALRSVFSPLLLGVRACMYAEGWGFGLWLVVFLLACSVGWLVDWLICWLSE